MRARTLRMVGGLSVLALVGAACGSDAGSSSDALTVLAASSLTDAFGDLGDAFAQLHPDTDLTFSFASSSDLARQVIEGAPGDVYASADLANMAKVSDAGAASGDPVVFATNRAEIIVAPGNPLGITGVDDLATRDLVVVVCAPEVPCGTYAAEIFDKAGAAVVADSLENNVKAVVTKVTLGEADAGVVYATDVLAAGDAASGVEIPADVNVVADYPIVALSDNPAARTFIDFVTSQSGQDILASYGFTPPR